jgi:hypothetical protein
VLEMSKKQCNKNVDFAICKIAIKSQPLNQDQIWIVDSSPCQGFEDRVLKMSKNINHKNPDIAICKIAIVIATSIRIKM